MKKDFELRVSSVEWKSYEHPCLFDQSRIPGLLLQIVRGQENQRLDAADDLLDVTAHQGNVGPSAVPTAGFLIEMLEEMPPSVQAAILEILFYFSYYCRRAWSTDAWSTELRAPFLNGLLLFRHLSTSADEDVSDCSAVIIENLQADD